MITTSIRNELLEYKLADARKDLGEYLKDMDKSYFDDVVGSIERLIDLKIAEQFLRVSEKLETSR